jgi:hypothetical protein
MTFLENFFLLKQIISEGNVIFLVSEINIIHNQLIVVANIEKTFKNLQSNATSF